MTIDITKFLIIKPSDLATIYDKLNIVPITSVDGTYLETLIIANIFAYFIIILFIWCLFKLKKMIFGSRRNYQW